MGESFQYKPDFHFLKIEMTAVSVLRGLVGGGDN